MAQYIVDNDGRLVKVAGNVGARVDVRVNGVSVIDGASANINTNSAYNATTNKIATMQDITDALGEIETLLSEI